jgi:hypothetical protein
MQVEIMATKVLGLAVCSNATDKELPQLVKRVNDMHPCGTTNGWVLSTRPECAPVICAEKPATHRHFIFDC